MGRPRILVRRSAVALATLALAGGAVIPASFAVDASRTGSYSWSNRTAAFNEDQANDGRFTSVRYKNAGGNGTFVNKKGVGQVVGGTTGTTVTKVQACISRGGFLPMACTGWNEDQ